MHEQNGLDSHFKTTVILHFKIVWDNFQTPVWYTHLVSLALRPVLLVGHKYFQHRGDPPLQIKTVLTYKSF